MGMVKLLNDFLRDAGIDPTAPAKAGPSQRRRLDASIRDELRSNLSIALKSSNRWMMIWTGVAIAILVFDAVIALRFSGNEKVVLGIVGGGAGAFLYVLSQMKRMISGHIAAKTLLAILPNLAPEEWVTVVKAMTNEVLTGLK
jgi:hypothetical protein